MVLTLDDENKHYLFVVWDQELVEVKMIMDLNNLEKKTFFSCLF